MKAQQSPTQEDAVLGTRAAAVLATALRDTLQEARELVVREAQFVPPGSVERLDALLEQFEKHRIRIAFFGEVKAGKSTLVNAVAGQILSPVAFDPLTSVPVRITYGKDTQWQVGGRVLTDLAEFEQWMRSESAGTSEVVISTPLELLALGGQVDLLDTPGLGGRDTHFDRVTEETIRSLDAAVLVVRYPALFTRFTHELVERLATHISTLFVVWNLDPTSRELAPGERDRHARSLSENIGIPHRLFLVDARTALSEGLHSEAGRASGMVEFAQALRSFVASTGREVAALRETAKAGVEWIAAVLDPLRERFQQVSATVADVHAQLSRIENEGEQELAEARARQSQFEAALARFVEQGRRRAQQRAHALVQQLHRARRLWMRTGHLLRLERAVAVAVEEYAKDLAALARQNRDELVTAAAAFGADVSIAARAMNKPAVARLTSEDRNVRANSGSLRWLRRALWAQWYLPGLADLEQRSLRADVASFEQWLQSAAEAAQQAARVATGERLRQIRDRTDLRLRQVREETRLDVYEAEATLLERGLPLLERHVERIQELAHHAQLLVRPADGGR